MEYVIAILLVIIIYYLYKTPQQKEEQAGRTQTNSYRKSTKRPAFSKQEYNKAWANYVDGQYDLDVALGRDPSPWLPPDYEECKDDIQYLEKLLLMTEYNKKKHDELKSRGTG